MHDPHSRIGSLIRAIALTLAFCAFSSRAEAQSSPAAETFAIPSEPPPRVGDRARIESDATRTLSTQAIVGTNVVRRLRETTRFRLVASGATRTSDASTVAASDKASIASTRGASGTTVLAQAAASRVPIKAMRARRL